MQLFHFTLLFMSNTVTCLWEGASSCCQLLSVYLILSLFFFFSWNCLFSYTFPVLVSLVFLHWNLYKCKLSNRQLLLTKKPILSHFHLSIYFLLPNSSRITFKFVLSLPCSFIYHSLSSAGQAKTIFLYSFSCLFPFVK